VVSVARWNWPYCFARLSQTSFSLSAGRARFSGDDLQRRKLAPQHVDHLGVFAGGVFHLLGVGFVEVVGNLVVALGDLVGAGQGKGGPGGLARNFFVLGPKLPQASHPALGLSAVGAKVESVLATEAVITSFPPQIGAIPSLCIRLEISLAGGHGGVSERLKVSDNVSDNTSKIRLI
jgi:hypothetical protein